MSAHEANPAPHTLADTPLQVVERISAKARCIRIEIRPDGEVRLVIPRFVARAQAHAFLQSRLTWIQRKRAEIAGRAAAPRPAPLRWDGSDRLPLRGTPTRLELIAAALPRPQVRFGETIALFGRAQLLANPPRLRAVLLRALQDLARDDARAVLDAEAQRLGVGYLGPRIADQRSLWGSCAPDGSISLSWRLVLAPPPVLRYVAVHELCHRRHADHSPRFWALVERQLPDYADARHWLRRHGGALHLVLPRAPDV
jgi:predicted metal-dependent hydrolase